MADTYRVTSYTCGPGEFTERDYLVPLRQALSTDYFCVVIGSDAQSSARGPDDDGVRVSQDPHGNFQGGTSSPDEIRLTRGASTHEWRGTVQVIECLGDAEGDGFRLKQIIETHLDSGAPRALQSTEEPLTEPHTERTVPFAGVRGGGFESSGTSYNDYGVTFGLRARLTAGQALTLERYGAEGRIPRAGVVTTYVVEWGANWHVQAAHIDDWRTGRNGANHPSAYTTAPLSSVERDKTWVLHSGYSHSDGLGDGFFGIVTALGDGVAQNSSESKVAVGSEYAGDRRFSTVYILSNPTLRVGHLFKRDGSTSDLSGTIAIDPPLGSEEHEDTPRGPVTSGLRAVLATNTCSGTGQAYPRPVLAWRLSAADRATWERRYLGQPFCAWAQVIDFARFAHHAELPLTVTLDSTLIADPRLETELLV
jgi:hypothetical protein